MLGSPCREERFAGVDVGDVYRAERGDSVAHGPHLGVQQIEVVVVGLYAESGRPLGEGVAGQVIRHVKTPRRGMGGAA